MYVRVQATKGVKQMTVEQDSAAMFGAMAMAKALRGEPTTRTETLYAARAVCQDIMRNANAERSQEQARELVPA